MKISIRRSNLSDTVRAPDRIGGIVCHGLRIYIPRNTTPILGGCQLLDYVDFPMRISEHIMASSLKMCHVLCELTGLRVHIISVMMAKQVENQSTCYTKLDTLKTIRFEWRGTSVVYMRSASVGYQ